MSLDPLNPLISVSYVEDHRLLELYYQDFHFAGAHLTLAERIELATINEELSKFEAEFAHKLLAVEELDGLSDNEIATLDILTHRSLRKWIMKASFGREITSRDDR